MNFPDRPNKKRPVGHGKRIIRSDEVALWNEVTKSINPLILKAEANGSISDSFPVKSKLVDYDQYNDLAVYVAPNRPSIKPNYQHGKAPGLDRKTQSRMRRGKIEYEGRLDLHGLTQIEAHRKLIRFIEEAYRDGRRSVLVITGKGLTRDGEVGVLRRSVPKWLNELPMSKWIKGFDYAVQQHGGEGALYVLIRRKK